MICFRQTLSVLKSTGPGQIPRLIKQKDPEERNSLLSTDSIECTTQSICEKSN